jgi:hypothetical protein
VPGAEGADPDHHLEVGHGEPSVGEVLATAGFEHRLHTLKVESMRPPIESMMVAR